MALPVHNLIQNHTSLANAGRRIFRLERKKRQSRAILGFRSRLFVFMHARRQFGQKRLRKLEDDPDPRSNGSPVLACRQKRPGFDRAQHFFEKWRLALYDSYVGKPSPGIHLGVKQDLTAEQRLRRKGCRDQRERSRSGEPFGFLDGSLPKPRALESRMPGNAVLLEQ